MDINPNDFPVTILFSGNVYDFRGLQFFTIINKDRFKLNQIKLDPDELNFICKKHGNKHYIRFDFLQFIYEVGEYHRWLNNYSNDITNPKAKNIFYQFLYFPDTANNNNFANINNKPDTNYRKILKNYILFNGNTVKFQDLNHHYQNFLSLYDRNKLSIDHNIFINFLKTFLFENIHGVNICGVENNNNTIITDINHPMMMSDVLESVYTYPRLFVKHITNSNFNNNFIYKNNTPKMFDSLEINYINILFDISKKLIDNYTITNLIPNNNKDFHPIINIKERNFYPGYYNNEENVFNGTIKKIKNNEFKFIFTPLDDDDSKEKKETNNNMSWLVSLITELKEINTYDSLIDRIHIALLKKIDSKNELLKKLQKIKNNYNMQSDFIQIIEKYLQEDTYIKKIKLNNDKHYAKYNKLLSLSENNLSYIEISNKKDKIIIKPNGINNKNIHFITYSSIINQWINKRKDWVLSLIEIDPNKCFSLGLNMDLEVCSLNIIEVLLEDNYGPNTKRFFENDDKFYIHLHSEFKVQFKPNPYIILSLLKKLKFKKKSINIYNHNINIIENYASWAKHTTNKRLLNQRNLKIYIEKALLYINTNISILNPQHIDIITFIKSLKDQQNEYDLRLPIIKSLKDQQNKEEYEIFIKILIDKFSNGNQDYHYDYVGMYNMTGGSSGQLNNYSGNIIYAINKIYNRFKKLSKNNTTRSRQYIKVLKELKHNAEVSILLNN